MQASEQPLYWWQWLAILGRVAKLHGTPRQTVMPVSIGRRAGMSNLAAINAMRRLARGVFVEEPVKRGKNRAARRAEAARARGRSTP